MPPEPITPDLLRWGMHTRRMRTGKRRGDYGQDNRRIVAVLGTPCGGTKYTALSLRAMGLHSQHENLGPEGIVCGFVGVDRHAKCRLEDYEWGTMWRVIRHPLRVLETLPRFVNAIERGGHREGDAPHPPWDIEDVIRGALQWWNLLHSRWAHLPAVRIEYYVEDFLPLWEELHRLQPELPERPDGKPLLLDSWRRSKGRPETGAGRWPRKTWDELLAKYPEEASQARAITIAHYGTDEVPQPQTPG